MNPYHIIKTVSVTEKSAHEAEDKKYTFVVDPRADKLQIKRAVETIFDRKVESVNTLNRRGKSRRTRYGSGKRSDWKKAVVTLKEGQEPIDLF